ncbi:MAG: hypothetical protein HEP71_26890 [Roseivirga sp.]|nr:hypothetical protein [Roseivirga sp.]
MGRNKPYSIFNLIVGALIMFVNLYWIKENLRIYWLYNTTTDVLLFLPDWALLVSAAFGLLGMTLAVQVIENKMGPLIGLFLELILFVFGVFFETFSIMLG